MGSSCGNEKAESEGNPPCTAGSYEAEKPQKEVLKQNNREVRFVSGNLICKERLRPRK